jgi:hypothetical protein
MRISRQGCHISAVLGRFIILSVQLAHDSQDTSPQVLISAAATSAPVFAPRLRLLSAAFGTFAGLLGGSRGELMVAKGPD